MVIKAARGQVKQSLVKQIEAILPSPKAVVAVVGAGGKTTCVYRLAEYLIAAQKKVLVTTTTKMFHPQYEKRDNWKLFPGPFHGSEIRWPNIGNQIDIAALTVDRNQNKLIGFAADEIDEAVNEGRYDYILVEADGAKQKPIKAPAPQEPVIPGTASIIIGIVGLDSLGKPINEANVHRPDLLADLTSQPLGSHITESTLVKLICSQSGLFKNSPDSSRKIVVLNKADNEEITNRGKMVVDMLKKEKGCEVSIHQTMVGNFA
ncbi:MAG: putative selenium-dependent hydroxylase accessory protein YqeC [Proteobacteria bacterium]|nr:putative selenium-dependent hydroxylase accessory protein YqeC [Pseudomonadota bacterium]